MGKIILIVEDDTEIQDILKNHLEDAGYGVRIAADGVEGISKFDASVSLVLLDVMLPKIDGFGVCEVIRAKSQVPIIMLTALADEESQVRGFKQQIDDYVPKPFSTQILLYKIAAMLRRGTEAKEERKTIKYKDLCMDIEGFHLWHKGQEIILTQKEFELLRIMLENKGRVFTRNMLLDRLWDGGIYVEERTVDSHIKNIRKKLDVDYIETIRGVGYRIDKSD